MDPRLTCEPDYAGHLLIEDLCSDLVRYLHACGEPSRLGSVRIDREWPLGGDGSYADLRVTPDCEAPYFLEAKYGRDARTLVAVMRRKYGGYQPEPGEPARVVLVVETRAYADWPALEREIRGVLAPGLELEVWDEARFQQLSGDCFGKPLVALTGEAILQVRAAKDEANDRLAFGDRQAAGYSERALRGNLLWHFGAWRLRELRLQHEGDDLSLLVPPGPYDQVVVIMADLSNFSRYMHDTADSAIVGNVLTSFYAKTRHQVLNAGGMLVNFVGDEIVAMFGVPDRRCGYLDDAVRTAHRLVEIGASVANDWQRRIDHVQTAHGVHVAMAMGRVQLVEMRPLDHSRLGAIGSALGIAERLLPLAQCGEIVISNVLHHALSSDRYEFEYLGPTEAHNLGTIQPWRLVGEGRGKAAELMR